MLDTYDNFTKQLVWLTILLNYKQYIIQTNFLENTTGARLRKVCTASWGRLFRCTYERLQSNNPVYVYIQ